MAGRKLDDREKAAAKIAAGVLGGKWQARDVDGAPDRTHDFDVELADGHVVALEVTAATDEEVQKLRAAAFGRRYPGRGLADDWLIFVGERPGGEQVNIGKLMRGIVSALQVFERYGLEYSDTRVSPRDRMPPPGTPQEVADEMMKQYELGAAMARRLGPRQSSEAELFPHTGHFINANLEKINELIETEAKANSEKLAGAEADERHLFIWLSPTHGDAVAEAFLRGPPERPPTLPDGVDVAWLAAPAAQRFWRVRPPADWEVLDPAALPVGC